MRTKEGYDVSVMLSRFRTFAYLQMKNSLWVLQSCLMSVVFNRGTSLNQIGEDDFLGSVISQF